MLAMDVNDNAETWRPASFSGSSRACSLLQELQAASATNHRAPVGASMLAPTGEGACH